MCWFSIYERSRTDRDVSLLQVYPKPAGDLITVEGQILKNVSIYNVNEQLKKKYPYNMKVTLQLKSMIYLQYLHCKSSIGNKKHSTKIKYKIGLFTINKKALGKSNAFLFSFTLL